jgi:uncharacterized protein (DUF952 family)
MSKSIVPNLKSKLPIAIAKEKDGITLYWVDELNLSGLHMQGLAQLLECNVGSIQYPLRAVKEISLLDAEIVTEGGAQGVSIITENDLPKLLRHISRSKAKIETRDRADDIRDRLAAAGFKLAVMLELAPEKLRASIKVPAESLAEWHEDRLQGKVVRRSLTDAIQLLCQYAAKQGSSQPERHYAHFSNLVNKYIIAAPIDSKVKDKRNRMSRTQLHYIQSIEMTLAKLIDDRMMAGDDYHEIYSVCKDRAAAIAAVLDIVPQPLLGQSNQRLINQSLARSLKAAA